MPQLYQRKKIDAIFQEQWYYVFLYNSSEVCDTRTCSKKWQIRIEVLCSPKNKKEK